MHISSSLAWLICITVAASTSLAVRSISPRAIVSSNDGQYKLSNYTAPTLGAGNAGSINSTWSLSIDDTASGHKQQLTGFGAAVTDATVSAFSLLPAAQQTALLNDLFSPTKGIGFSLMRHTIAASDLSSDVYSYDNVSAPDVPLAHFNLTSEGSAMVTWLHRMRAINPAMRLLGSVWSPPGWMKLNGVQSGTTVNNNLNPVYSSSYAQYFVNYIKVFAARGVPVDAITIQNEPLNSQSGFPTMYVSAANSTHLIQKYVGPALKNASLATQIWAYDHNTDVPSYPQQVLDGAGAFVKTVAWHCYATNNDWGVLTNFSKANPGVRQYMTECWTSPQTPWYQSIDFVMVCAFASFFLKQNCPLTETYRDPYKTWPQAPSHGLSAAPPAQPMGRTCPAGAARAEGL